MASSSGEGTAGGGGGDGGQDNRRYPQTLQGLLQFSAEHTTSTGESATNTAAVLDPEKGPQPTSRNDNVNDPVLARTNQDKALQVLGLHRYRIAGDGNCLFRAVSKQLNLDQERFHPILRTSAVKWMRGNKDELLEWGLLDGENEISETEIEGAWPGQAAIVALANILGINIAVIQGGDKGDIDIQHICPFETPNDKEQGSIILAYLYNGHYDAVVEEANVANPEFEAWTLQRNKEFAADEALARQLAAEEMPVRGEREQPVSIPVKSSNEREMSQKEAETASERLAKQLLEEDYKAVLAAAAAEENSKISSPSSSNSSTSPDPSFRHVSEVKVNYSRPVDNTGNSNKTSTLDSVRSYQNSSSTAFISDTFSGRSKNKSPENLQHSYPYSSSVPEKRHESDFAPRTLQTTRGSPTYGHRTDPTPPPRTKPIRSYSEDDAPTLKLTLYPRRPLHPECGDVKQSLLKSTPDELRVTRQPPTNNALRERQIYDNITSSHSAAYSSSPRSHVSSTSPSSSLSHNVRIIPVQYTSKDSSIGGASENLDRRAGIRRREYAQLGSSSSWSHSSASSDMPSRYPHLDSAERSNTYRPSSNTYSSDTYHKPTNVPNTRVYKLAEEPSYNTESYHHHYSSSSSTDPYRKHSSTPQTRIYTLANECCSEPSSSRNLRSETRSYQSPSGGSSSSRSREIPVMVLNPSLTPLPSHARATPAPVTFDLEKNSQRPPQLQPFRRNINEDLLERRLQRRDFWL